MSGRSITVLSLICVPFSRIITAASLTKDGTASGTLCRSAVATQRLIAYATPCGSGHATVTPLSSDRVTRPASKESFRSNTLKDRTCDAAVVAPPSLSGLRTMADIASYKGVSVHTPPYKPEAPRSSTASKALLATRARAS